MFVKNLELNDFRNYKAATATLLDGVNIVTGKNAQGKTNLIEAVYCLATGRSFRSAKDKELVSFGSEKACIQADIMSGGREQMLEARFFHGRRREFYANGVKLKKASDLSGRLMAVMFGPDDLDMIKGGASVRRKMMDQCLAQLRPGYAVALAEFSRLYEHKSRILRDYREKPYLIELLDDYDSRLAEQSARLIYYRSAFVGILSRKAACVHEEFSSGAEKLTIRYKTVGGMDAIGRKPEQLLHEILEHQRAHRQAELGSGLCLTGAHKDDLIIEINGIHAREFASQGQARTASVSIKLAERDVYFDDKGEHPILLLDDVLSELDAARQSFVLGKIKQGQIIITCCDENVASLAPGVNVLRIENGTVTKG